MAKVPPYHTDFEEHPAEYRDVYHGHDDCPDGRLILPHHRRSGRGVNPNVRTALSWLVLSHGDHRLNWRRERGAMDRDGNWKRRVALWRHTRWSDL